MWWQADFGHVALISGGARGQGASHGALFAREGASVVLADVRKEEGQRQAEALRDGDRNVVFAALDVTSSTDWESAVALAESESADSTSSSTTPASSPSRAPLTHPTRNGSAS